VGKFLKDLLFTTLMVMGATMVTAAVVAVLAVLMATSQAASTTDAGMALYVVPAAMIMALLLGFFFSFFSVCVAAVTMPPAIGLIRGLKLARPLFDILGGGASGLLCAAAFAGFLHSVEQAKGGNLSSEVQPMLDICGMLGGAALGYLRHLLLVRPKDSQPHLHAPGRVEAAGVS
jgi:hypothetical protein